MCVQSLQQTGTEVWGLRVVALGREEHLKHAQRNGKSLVRRPAKGEGTEGQDAAKEEGTGWAGAGLCHSELSGLQPLLTQKYLNVDEKCYMYTCTRI